MVGGGAPKPSRFGRQASLSANRTDSSRGEPVTAGGHLACRFLPDKLAAASPSGGGLEACRPGQARHGTSPSDWRTRSLTSIAVNRPYHLFFRELRSAFSVEESTS
jgi:hypothetical protein